MISERIELVAGVCPLIYRQEQPEMILINQELTPKN